jgi:uncharacterized SAM-binding protein YcdF (DUF218 family)
LVLFLKLCAIPLYPLGLALTLSIAGLVVLRFQLKYGKYLIAAGVAVLYIVSTPIFSRLLIKTLETPYVTASEFPGDCPAIVVLGGGGMKLAPPMVYPEINSAGDRILHAARLYKMGVAPRIITTGGAPVGAFQNYYSEGEQNALLLREIGVDSLAIIIEKKARTTADHAPLIAAILDSMKLPKKIVLVTSASHMYRSVEVFRKAGYTVYPAATDFKGSGRLVESIMDFFPLVQALGDATYAVHEYYGILGYRVLGKI